MSITPAIAGKKTKNMGFKKVILKSIAPNGIEV